MNNESIFAVGTDLDSPPSAEEAMRAAGLDWELQGFPIQHGAPHIRGRKIDNYVEWFRVTPDGTFLDEAKPLLISRGRYEPFQNLDAFRGFDPIVQRGLGSYTNAGSLDNGKKVYLQLDNGRTYEPMPGDEVRSLTTLTHSHDQTYAIRAGFTPIVIVCRNTFNAAQGSMGGVAVRHTMNADGRMEVVLDEVLAELEVKTGSWIDQVEEMVRQRFDEAEAQQFAIDVAQARKVLSGGERATTFDDLHVKTRPIAESIYELIEAGDGAELRGGTGWRMYNGVTDFVDHASTAKTDDRRTLNALFLHGATMKETAARLAMRQLSLV